MVPNTFKALLDANVIYRSVLRDVLLWCADAYQYRMFWSQDILNEVTRNLVKNGVMSSDKASKLAASMRDYFPEAMVTGYEYLIPSMRNEEGDRHVAAAAHIAGADVIVTLNVKDFKDLPANLAVQSPDEFLCYLFDLYGDDMANLLEEQVKAHTKVPCTLPEILAALEKDDVAPNFVAAVRAHLANRAR